MDRLLADVRESRRRGALATLQHVIREHPHNERLYPQLAERRVEQDAHDVGMEVTDAGIVNVRNACPFLTMRGVLLPELGRYEEAEAAFKDTSTLADRMREELGRSRTKEFRRIRFELVRTGPRGE